MFILLLFSFLGGIVTILSPCILPILPIVLSGSLTGGKRRPLGIITGFIFSFTFFTLFLTTIIKLLGLSADVLRNVAMIVVFVFGLSLILPQLQKISEKLFFKLANLVPLNTQKNGFCGGILVGISLGLVWTPCVGPILASIITLAATSHITLGAILITFMYSVGTAIPLLLITYGGRQFLQKVPLLTQNTAKIQHIFGILMLLTALAIYFNIDRRFQTFILTKFPQYGTGLTQLEDNPQVKQALEKIKTEKPMLDSFKNQAPDFSGGTKWLNSKPLSLTQLRGKVVLIDFWTYTCINCIRTLPFVTSWYEKYKDKGLVIIGVHTPEFEFEKNPENVLKAMKEFKITYPVVQDNDYHIWNAYHNRYWPAEYFIDKNGVIRKTHFGEGNYEESEKFIQELLQETGVQTDGSFVNISEIIPQAQTPETYLGYARLDRFGSHEPIQKDTSTTYSIPKQLNPHEVAYSGTWMVGSEYTAPTKNAALYLNFTAKEVYLVMRPKNQTTPGLIRVYLDNQLITTSAGVDVVNNLINVNEDRLYKLVKLDHAENHLLKLEFLDDNVEIYAFTFG